MKTVTFLHSMIIPEELTSLIFIVQEFLKLKNIKIISSEKSKYINADITRTFGQLTLLNPEESYKITTALWNITTDEQTTQNEILELKKEIYTLFDEEFNKVDTLIVFTPNGKYTDTIGTIMKVANYLSIPIINIGDKTFETNINYIINFISLQIEASKPLTI